MLPRVNTAGTCFSPGYLYTYPLSFRRARLLMSRSSTALLVVLVVSLATCGATVTLLRAHSQGRSVQLEWSAANNPSISGYEGYRPNYPADGCNQITSLTPKAQLQYGYTGQNAYQLPAHGAVTYRLAGGAATAPHPYHATLAQPTNNMITRSWDTIKLMFR